jgi:quercetin 2,3-dioxygenase
MRSIKKLHKAIDEPMNGLSTFRAFPNKEIDQIDPFLLLNHHGPQEFPPNNPGLPFGPHPHRGFETLTFILKGDVMHNDSGGGKSIIKAGGIQWMTAGSGIIHSENSSEEFKNKGGIEEILQLWINLPAKFKKTPPKYIGLNKNEVPEIKFDSDKVILNLISGKINGNKGPVDTLTDVFTSYIELKKEGTFNFRIDKERNILLYVTDGKIKINETIADKLF